MRIAVISAKCQSEYKIAADTVTSVRMCQRYYEKIEMLRKPEEKQNVNKC